VACSGSTWKGLAGNLGARHPAHERPELAGVTHGVNERAGLTTAHFLQTPVGGCTSRRPIPPAPPPRPLQAEPSAGRWEPCHLAVLCGLEGNPLLGFEAKITFFFQFSPISSAVPPPLALQVTSLSSFLSSWHFLTHHSLNTPGTHSMLDFMSGPEDTRMDQAAPLPQR